MEEVRLGSILFAGPAIKKMTELPELFRDRLQAVQFQSRRFALTYRSIIDKDRLTAWLTKLIEASRNRKVISLVIGHDRLRLFTHVLIMLNKVFCAKSVDTPIFNWDTETVTHIPEITRCTTKQAERISNYITNLGAAEDSSLSAPVATSSKLTFQELVHMLRPWQCALINMLELELTQLPLIIYTTVKGVGKTWLCKMCNKHAPEKYWGCSGDYNGAKIFLVDLPADDMIALNILQWLSTTPLVGVRLCIFTNRSYTIPFQGIMYQVTNPVGLLEHRSA